MFYSGAKYGFWCKKEVFIDRNMTFTEHSSTSTVCALKIEYDFFYAIASGNTVTM